MWPSRRHIAATDKEIDHVVYELDEGIAIAEGKSQ